MPGLRDFRSRRLVGFRRLSRGDRRRYRSLSSGAGFCLSFARAGLQVFGRRFAAWECVFSALKQQLEPSQQRELAAALPEEVDAWFLSA